jgi:hypothetical protein
MAINQKNAGDSGFIGFVKGQRYEVYGPSLLAARTTLARHCKVKPKDEYKINIMVAERPDGSEVVHSTAAI